MRAVIILCNVSMQSIQSSRVFNGDFGIYRINAEAISAIMISLLNIFMHKKREVSKKYGYHLEQCQIKTTIFIQYFNVILCT